jgi:hypothetical protein
VPRGDAIHIEKNQTRNVREEKRKQAPDGLDAEVTARQRLRCKAEIDLTLVEPFTELVLNGWGGRKVAADW